MLCDEMKLTSACSEVMGNQTTLGELLQENRQQLEVANAPTQ